MIEVRHSLLISKPAQMVWPALAQFDGIAQWAPNVHHSCLMTDQTEGVGTVRRVQTGRAALIERIVTWEPDHKLAYTITGLPAVVGAVTNTWRLEQTGSQQTMVTLTTAIDAGSAPPKKLLAKGLTRPLGSASVQMLNGLKAHVEEAT